MNAHNYVPVIRHRKTTKYGWWERRWFEARETANACRSARILHKGVLKHDNIQLWREQISIAEASIKKYQQLIENALFEDWTSID